MTGFAWLGHTMRADTRAGILLGWPPEAGAKISGKCSRGKKKKPHKKRRVWATRGKQR